VGESIRARFVAVMDAHERATESHFALQSVGYRKPIQIQLDRQRQVFAAIRAHALASWWIDNRTMSLAILTAAEYRATEPSAVRYEPKPPLH
jgi:hypothetical protein